MTSYAIFDEARRDVASYHLHWIMRNTIKAEIRSDPSFEKDANNMLNLRSVRIRVRGPVALVMSKYAHAGPPNRIT